MPISNLGPNENLIGMPGSRYKLNTPALIIDLNLLEQNIDTMAKYCSKTKFNIRPVAKIHKSVEIAVRQINAGALGVSCATLKEAEIMADNNIPGILLFTTVVTDQKINRLMEANKKVEQLMVAVDSFDNVEALDAAACKVGKKIGLLVDFEVGGKRTGLADEEKAVYLAKRIYETDGLIYQGIQGYNGKTQRILNLDERNKAQDIAMKPLKKLIKRLTNEGLAPKIVSGGGTGTLDIDSKLGLFTESQAGTYVFMDVNYKDLALHSTNPFPYKPSLFVQSTVVSNVQKGFVITDAGIKEFAREEFPPEISYGAPSNASYELVGDDLGRVNFHDLKQNLPLGALIECIPPHCYATLNLYNVFHCVRDDKLVDIWPISSAKNW